jgi:Tol biopolymer transport system component
MRAPLILLLAALACVLTAAANAAAPVKRVSVSSSGKQANGSSSDVAMSANGRFVVFQSAATNLVKHDTNGVPDVFVRDRKSGSTFRVSVSSSGEQGDQYSGSPSISADGRYVVFSSDAENLVPNDGNNRKDIFVRDRKTKKTYRVSLNSAEEEADGSSDDPSISADGRFVTFQSDAENLASIDTEGRQNVYLRDRKKGITRLISIGIGGAAANGESSICGGYAPAISADGRYVAFHSEANNIVPNDLNGKGDVFVRSWKAGKTRRVSVSSAGLEGNIGGSSYCSISAGGKLVAFESDSENLVPHDTKGVTDVFVHNWKTRKTARVSLTARGTESKAWSGYSGISANGRFVIFESPDGNLVKGDKNGRDDLFVHDRWTSTTRRVTFGKKGGTNGNGYGWISSNGRFIVYESDLLLVKHDTNGVTDIFVRGPFRWPR